MDYAFINAVRYWAGLLTLVLLLYDVACQYYKKLRERIKGYRLLKLPDNTKLRFGIGLFHIHGHQDECYPRFAPTFMDGVGEIAGEIGETTWPPLDEAAGSLRTMGTAHRQESIDMIMGDSNWKKHIRMCRHMIRLTVHFAISYHRPSVHSLLVKYPKTVQGALEHSAAFRELCASTDARKHGKEWSNLARSARNKRYSNMKNVGEMKIYSIDKKKCRFIARRWYVSSLIQLNYSTESENRSQRTDTKGKWQQRRRGWVACLRSSDSNLTVSTYNRWPLPPAILTGESLQAGYCVLC